jgi:excisionase family DNA binding protein
MNDTAADPPDGGLSRIVADAVAEALKAAGFSRRKRPRPIALAYSPPDAAAAAGVGTSTVYSAIKRNELRARKRGTRTVILASDLKRWLEALPSAPLSGGGMSDGG